MTYYKGHRFATGTYCPHCHSHATEKANQAGTLRQCLHCNEFFYNRRALDRYAGKGTARMMERRLKA
jgi:hypothetical protein